MLWKPLPQSHSANRMASLVVRYDVFRGESAASGTPLSTQRALLGFALKNAAKGSISLAVLKKEVRSFADTVYSLTQSQRDLYGSRIVLFIFAPEKLRRWWAIVSNAEVRILCGRVLW